MFTRFIRMTISTQKLDWCGCWNNKKDPIWHYEVYGDGHGRCKHCGKKMEYFHTPRKKATS